MIKDRLSRIIDATIRALPWVFGTILALLAIGIVLLTIRVLGEFLTAVFIIAEIILGA